MTTSPLRPARRLTVRTLQIALGTVWIVDGLLQLQPKMFTTAFADHVLAPTAQGQPGFIAWPVHELVRLVTRQPVGYDALFAAAQLLIGIGMLGRVTIKPALALSMVWVLGVWTGGEGLGMLFTGSASPLTGAPGGVLLYGLLAIIAWPRREPVTSADPAASASSGGLLGETGSRAVWAGLWVGMAVLWLLPSNRAGGAVASQIQGAAASSPGWLSPLDLAVAHWSGHAGTGLAVTLALLSLVIGVGPLVTRRPTAFLTVGAALSLDYWVFGQSLGGFTGLATDPNAAPLFILLALALFPNSVPAMAPQAGPTTPPTPRRYSDTPVLVPAVPDRWGVSPGR
jgi:hypothetical protein